MNDLRESVNELGYDTAELEHIVYTSLNLGFDPNPADSCDGGCTRKCKSCKDGCETSVKG